MAENARFLVRMDIPELKELRMSKHDLAREMGVSVQTVYGWKEVPGYVQAYLRLRMLLKRAYGRLGCYCTRAEKFAGKECEICQTVNNNIPE